MMVIEINAVMQSIKVLRDLVQANRSLRNLDLLPIEWVKKWE